MKITTKIGDVVFMGGKINGVETTVEFASTEEFEKYQKEMQESLDRITKFFKEDLPEITKNIILAVENTFEEIDAKQMQEDPIEALLNGLSKKQPQKTPSPEDFIGKIILGGKPDSLNLKPKEEGLKGLKPLEGDGINFNEVYKNEDKDE